MIIGAARRVVFRHATMLVGQEEAVTIFDDHSVNLLDIRQAASDPDYLGYAASCGYDGGVFDYRRYAKHHDLTHNWLADQADKRSAVLWHDARGEKFAEWEREEHHVNCLQRLWSDRTRRIEWRDKEIKAAREALGAEWQGAVRDLSYLLDRIP